MTEHHVWVLQADGSVVAVEETAHTLEAAQRALAARGYRVLETEDRKGLRDVVAGRWLRALRPRIAAYDDLLAQQLQILIRAGIGPVEALRALSRQASGGYAEALSDLQARLETGSSLADAVDADGRFDPLLVALLRAAEQTSGLEEALQRFLQHRQRVDALRERAVTSAVYPLLLMTVGTLVLLFLLFYVVPRFSGIFQSVRVDLPWGAMLMMRWGQMVEAHLPWIAGALAAAVGLAAWALLTPRIRTRLLAGLARRGWLGQQLRLVHLCRYYRTLASLLGGGIALAQSMAMANRLLPAYLAESGAVALRHLSEGRTPAEALEAGGLSTPVADQLIQVGQRTGQLAEMLERIADFHDEAVGRTIERFMRVLEPAVMTAVGVAIGVVVVLMYMPIFELAGAVR